jgi:predicted glutamine amidotransferase
MCELLGLSFNCLIKPRISFTGFRERGEDNPDGWGLAFYPDESAQIIKEPLRAGRSSLSHFLENYPELESRIIIGHVRKRGKTGAPAGHKNTHPFARELNGKDYVFAHNGNLERFGQLELGRFQPLGKTDSEHAFCHLLSQIEEREIDRWVNEDFYWLADKLKTINALGTFSCIFSDGRYLFAYRDLKGERKLSFTHRQPPYGQVRLVDEYWEINLNEEKDQNETGFIIATNPLTDENWESFQNGELIIFHDGEQIFSNVRDLVQFSVSKIQVAILRALRSVPHRLSFKAISARIKVPEEDLRTNIKRLLDEHFILQDSRDSVDWDHGDATFYTEPDKRDEIRELLSS